MSKLDKSKMACNKPKKTPKPRNEVARGQSLC